MKPNSLRKDCRNEKCSPGEYLCKRYPYCINSDMICDGVKHCLYGDDEFFCGKETSIIELVLHILITLFLKRNVLV